MGRTPFERPPGAMLKWLPLVGTRPRRLRRQLEALSFAQPLGEEGARRLIVLLDELVQLRATPRQRLELLELARPVVRRMVRALERHYLNLPLLPPASGQHAAALAHGLAESMTRGYEGLVQSLSGALRARPGRQIAAIALQRATSAVGGQLFLHSLLYTQAEAGLWARLHKLYAMAEAAALEGVAVTDTLLPAGSGSVHAAYMRALLIASAQPSQLRQPALMALYRAASRWAQQVALHQNPPDALFVVQLDQDAPPCLHLASHVTAEPHLLFFDPRPLASALTEGTPMTLSDVLSRHLRWVWLGPRRRRYPREPGGGHFDICLGLAGVHSQLSGDEQQAACHQVQARDRSQGGYRLEWQGETPHELRVGSLAALRDSAQGTWRVGEIRWVQSAIERVHFGVALLPSSVRPVWVSDGHNSDSHNSDSRNKGALALLLPAPTPVDSDILLLPAQGYRSGEQLEIQACCAEAPESPARPVRLGLRVGGSPDVTHYTLRDAGETYH